jgi:hypothetical protein
MKGVDGSSSSSSSSSSCCCCCCCFSCIVAAAAIILGVALWKVSENDYVLSNDLSIRRRYCRRGKDNFLFTDCY